MSEHALEEACESWAEWLKEFDAHLAPLFAAHDIPKGLAIIAYLINRQTNLTTNDPGDNKEDWQK